VDLGRFFSFLIYTQSIRVLGWGSARRKAATNTEQHKQNKRGQTFMPRVGFEPTIPVFDWAKTVRALDRATIVIGYFTTRVIKWGFRVRNKAMLQQS
jgi:hypothetical protein